METGSRCRTGNLGVACATDRCTDPDDQKFIDLALSLPGATLLSRDRAVLKLARRARPLGMTIVTPQAWSATLTGQGGEQVAGG